MQGKLLDLHPLGTPPETFTHAFFHPLQQHLKQCLLVREMLMERADAEPGALSNRVGGGGIAQAAS